MMTSLGSQIPHLVRDFGISTVFGIPGVHTVELYREFHASGLRHITPRHEQGAGFMADGYARASGQVAACFIITGPGMTNIATALGQAFSDSVPMLIISSVNRTVELGRGEGRLHELPDQRALVSGVTRKSIQIRDPAEIISALQEASDIFSSRRPGPVHIEIPLDVLAADVQLEFKLTQSQLLLPSKAAIELASRALREALKPLIIIGGGAVDASHEIQLMVEKLGAPAVLTIAAKGVLPVNHPNSLGSTLPQPAILEYLRTADVVLALGTELSETDTLLFDQDLKMTGKLIRVDIDPGQLVRNPVPEIAINADAGQTAMALAVALEGHKPRLPPRTIRQLKQSAMSELADVYKQHGNLLGHLQHRYPNLLIVGDSTQPIYGANIAYDTHQPRSYFNSSTGYGTLGYALPAALGAKLACPDKPVLCVTGDGGLQFTIGELATAVELQLPVPILVWNNRGFGEIKNYMKERSIPEIGVDIYTPDFVAIARGFGCEARRVQSINELSRCLDQAFAAIGPTVINVMEEDAMTWLVPDADSK